MLYLPVVGSLFVSCSPKTAEKHSERPNIIVILADDMGFSDVGCFGSEIKTPNIDRLAANGIRFTQFYNTARCSPTRASLLTGLYPHQANMGWLSPAPYTEPGFVGDLSKDAVTMAEVFQQAGYSTYMTGKWHIAANQSGLGDNSNYPHQRGFDRFFGTLNGSGSFYDPGTLMSNNTFIGPGKDFYYTDAISDTAVKFIRENPKDKPFFFYVAYTAAHWPLMAPEKVVEKYKEVYDIGWDSIRVHRYNRLRELGIIDENCALTIRGEAVPAWEDEPLKEWQARRMEVYAAMIDVMDQGIGRIISALEEKGELDNTLIFFLQDNGGCAEPLDTESPQAELTADQKILKPLSYDSVYYGKRPEYARDGRYIRSGRGVMPGEADTWIAYGEEWANVSNTPFRLYKHWTHEGGISTPLIVHWPAQVKAKGELRTQPGHLIDIMATCLDITKMEYPQTYNGHTIQAPEGISLLPAFDNKTLERDHIFWEHEGNRALRMGNWKLVSRTIKNKRFTEADENAWELYDMDIDRAETNNLASQYPERVKQMIEIWEKEAIRTKAKPWPYTK